RLMEPSWSLHLLSEILSAFSTDDPENLRNVVNRVAESVEAEVAAILGEKASPGRSGSARRSSSFSCSRRPPGRDSWPSRPDACTPAGPPSVAPTNW
ncbi:MAG: hypothetical protein ACKOZN_05455, partial [Cyanobium sp.]